MGPDGGLTLSDFWEAWELFRTPTLAGTLAGALLGWLGVYVVLRRMVFLSAALSQCAGLGVTLAFYAQIHWGWSATLASPTAGASAATLLAALVPWFDRSAEGSHRDSLLGVLYLTGAAGTLVVGTRIVQELQDVQELLFGTAVAVLDEQLSSLVWLAVVVFALHLWWMRGFIQASFDPEGARTRGIPVGLLDGVLLVTLALTVSVCTRVLGALPVFAFTVLPALAAVRLMPNVPRALLLAGVLGAVSGFGGYVLAFLYALPVGATQTGLAAALVVVAEVIRRGLRYARPAQAVEEVESAPHAA